MSEIEAARVEAVYLPHSDERVVVVAHQAVGVAEPAVAIDGVAQDREEELAVVGGAEDRQAIVSSSEHVVEGARICQTQRSSHHIGRRHNRAIVTTLTQIRHILWQCKT
jgi:hypothetical protein